MSEPTLEQRLRDEAVPGEDAAEERAWRVVRAAHAERVPVPARSPARKLVAAFAAALALAALVLTPAGAEVVDVVRDVVGIDESATKPALDSLPAAGELLVESEAGPWIVREDGSKRLLGEYGQSTWSAPRGLYVAATDGRQLVALDPLGEVRWTVTAPADVHDPRWSPSGFRIVYRSGDDLRVVSGNGTGDQIVARNVAPVAPAWRPQVEAEFAKGTGIPGPEQLSFVDAHGRPRLIDAETGDEISEGPRPSIVPEQHGPIRELAWSPDGTRFFGMSEKALVTDGVGASNAGFYAYVATRGATLRELAVAPSGDELALLERGSGTSEVQLLTLSDRPRMRSGPLFAGPGTITDLTISPDGRWLLAGWRDADQWLFINADHPRRLVAFDDVSAQFDPGGSGNDAFPRVSGWVLPQR